VIATEDNNEVGPAFWEELAGVPVKDETTRGS
jgi:hypothetical protein